MKPKHIITVERRISVWAQGCDITAREAASVVRQHYLGNLGEVSLEMRLINEGFIAEYGVPFVSKHRVGGTIVAVLTKIDAGVATTMILGPAEQDFILN